jgi:hypothetical protein
LQASAATLSLEATGGVIQAVTVAEDGGDSRRVEAADLIGVSVTGVGLNGGDNGIQVFAGATAPATGQRAALVEDLDLGTGFYNMLAGNEFTFDEALTNGDGAELIIVDNFGTSFDITHLDGVALSTPVSFTRNDHDLDLDVARTLSTHGLEASTPTITTLQALENGKFTRGGSLGPQNVDGLAIDLTDLGVAAGASIQSVTIDGKNGLDLLYIGGLPVPEPGTAVLLGVGGLVCMRRRRGV